MKTLKISLTVLCFILLSCSKTSVNYVPPPTTLTIEAIDVNSKPVAGAFVHLYTSQADMENRINEIKSPERTDATGSATFTNLSPIMYYWYAESDCMNSMDYSSNTKTPLTASIQRTIISNLESTGRFALENVSNSPFHVYIDGIWVFDVNGGSAKITGKMPIGSHLIRCVQISGYVLTPTDESQTFYLTDCGVTKPIMFN
jgi:hypothetical protein